MANGEEERNQPQDEEEEPNQPQEEEDQDDEEEEEEEEDSDSDGGDGTSYTGAYSDSSDEDDDSPEATVRRFAAVLDSRAVKKREEREELSLKYPEDHFNFPRDPENWREEDLRELWADGPIFANEPGWDPAFADEEDWDMVREEVEAGRDPPIAPFYLPYRRYYPVIPDNHHDISTPKSVIEEMDRIEEFLKWVSFVFEDGSTYEGTVWDDLAHGKGVYVGEEGLVRYEGEWMRNEMEGHGVVEVDIPGVEPVPGSKLEAKMRAEGKIISRDFMSPEDKKWLEMDIEDSYQLAGNIREFPFYEREGWIKVFGHKPEKGRYKYAGQWKHGRMHGCGVYEVNERIIYGRFYFGEHLDDSTGCDSDVSALHAGIAEVAAAKSRMFVNKPDGMVREERGPYGDPQHPYFYEEDDVWMAPGFVNQFYKVPEYWETYVEDVDQEREMWLNSFYKAPLRIPMPAELEYWWSKDEGPEFVLINGEPVPDPEDPSNFIYTDDPLIVHTPTGGLINFVEDEEHGVRLFWQPPLKEGEDVDPEKAAFLPLGFDEFYGKAAPGPKKESRLMSMITSLENKLKPMFDRLDNWAEEKKKDREMNQKLIEKELEFMEAEMCLKEALEGMEDELKAQQKEEEKRDATDKGTDQGSPEAGQDESDSEDEEEDDDGAPTSFGTVGQGETDKDGNKSQKSSFSSLSMALASYTPVSMVNSSIFSSQLKVENPLSQCQAKICMVNFPYSQGSHANLGTLVQKRQGVSRKRVCGDHHLNSLARVLSSAQSCKSTEACVADDFSILSLHVPVTETFVLS